MKPISLSVFGAVSSLLFVNSSAQALEPQVLYGFQVPQDGGGELVQGSDGNLYGTINHSISQIGSIDGYGTVFQLTTSGVLTSLVTFSYPNGVGPTGLVFGGDGAFYGTTGGGGSTGSGTVFQLTTNGALTTLVSFNGTNGAGPNGLVLGRDGSFYGTSYSGGVYDPIATGLSGTVFRVTPDGVLTTLVSFNDANGSAPEGRLVQGRDDAFYGTTFLGGSSEKGTVFRVTTNGVLTTLVSFNGTPGWQPEAGLVLGRDGAFYGTTLLSNSGDGGTVFQVTTNGVLTTLISLNGTNGSVPWGLVSGNDGNFYFIGNVGDYATVFKMTTNGVLTTLASFNNANARHPTAALVLGADGNFYGTTPQGGSSDDAGTVFQVTTDGVLTTLVSFNGTNGSNPEAGLVLGTDGAFYGTTQYGGTSVNENGTVFRVMTNGALTTLVSFNGANGAHPQAGLVLGSNGNFYGTTYDGGSDGTDGTVFQVTTNGVLTTLLSFNYTNGANPSAGLVQGRDGNFYGTTSRGGSGGNGTVFQVTTNGVLTTLVSFTGTNGGYPWAALVLGRDGNFYGTTYYGGGSGNGTVFQVTTDGVLTTLLSFNYTNGAYPKAGLVLGRDGAFYGTTYGGGPGGGGTIFRVPTSPKFTNLTRQRGGSVLLTATGLPNNGCRLWATANLSLPFASWTLLTSGSFDSHANFFYTDDGAASNTSRFYRLSVP